ncbi:type III secretion apparatus protein OrgA/MxiK [Chromobacterium vaccinii]|uniref:Type III secretion apparatus protein OrgA/MxiK n=1 Tax=Chromobacterium vaccinii TaxID=1108595 RepID=A0ABV0F8S9_9NEIS
MARNPAISYAGSDEQASLVRDLLFNPLGYINPQRLRLAARLDNPQARGIVNDLLISGYGLDIHWPAAPLNSIARHYLRHWRQLPQAAYLMGCQILRSGLSWQGAMLRLPAWAQNFSCQALDASPCPPPGRALRHSDLLNAGYSQLRAWQGQLPAAMAQRLPLQFSPVVDSDAAAFPPSNALLLTLALQYARRHPFAPPADYY